MSVTLDWNNEQMEWNVTEQWIDKLEELLQFAANMENVTAGIVSLSFVDDETIHQLNMQYRGIDRPTDVLSFAMQEIGAEESESPAIDDELLGDIVISVPTAKLQSEEYGHSLEREIGFLFVHGFLHLIGYDHQDEDTEKAMFEKQELVLQKAGLSR